MENQVQTVLEVVQDWRDQFDDLTDENCHSEAQLLSNCADEIEKAWKLESEAIKGKGLVRGMVLAAAIFYRHWGDHPAIKEILGAAGNFPADYDKYEIDEFDRESLEGYWGDGS